MGSRRTNFLGEELALAGRGIGAGDHAPDFTVVAQDLSEVHCSAFRGKVKLITFFPSLDTSVCSDQVKEFNRRALGRAPGVAVIGISMDLPFAQKRFCEANAISGMEVFSDHLRGSFGAGYGVLAERYRMLARGAFIIDAGDTVRFAHIVDDVRKPVDFDAVSAALADTASSPAAPAPGFPWRCIPCEGPGDFLKPERLDELLARARGWERCDGGIRKEFVFRDFGAAMDFAGIVRNIAEEERYVPGLAVSGNRLSVRLSGAGGLTENEFIMSSMIDEITA